MSHDELEFAKNHPTLWVVLYATARTLPMAVILFGILGHLWIKRKR